VRTKKHFSQSKKAKQPYKLCGIHRASKLKQSSMIVATQEITSIFNWSLIEKSIVPDTFINVEENEDFELLFMVNIDEIKLKETLRSSQRPPGAAVRKFLWKRILLRDEGVAQSTIKSYNEKKSRLFGKDLDIQASLPNFVDTNHLIYYYLNDEVILI